MDREELRKRLPSNLDLYYCTKCNELYVSEKFRKCTSCVRKGPVERVAQVYGVDRINSGWTIVGNLQEKLDKHIKDGETNEN